MGVAGLWVTDVIRHSVAVAFNLQQYLFESRWALRGPNIKENGQLKPNHDSVSKMEWLPRRQEPTISSKQEEREEKFIRCQRRLPPVLLCAQQRLS